MNVMNVRCDICVVFYHTVPVISPRIINSIKNHVTSALEMYGILQNIVQLAKPPSV